MIKVDPKCATWYRNSLRHQDRTGLEKDITHYGDIPCPDKGSKFVTTGDTKYNVHFRKTGGDYVIDSYDSNRCRLSHKADLVRAGLPCGPKTRIRSETASQLNCDETITTRWRKQNCTKAGGTKDCALP